MFTVGTQPTHAGGCRGYQHLHDHVHSREASVRRSATVTIANDDPDENPYTFSLTGTGISPEINLKQGHDLDRRHRQLLVRQHPGGRNSGAITFTVDNLGTSDLNLSGHPEGGDQRDECGDVRVGTQPTTPVTPAGISTFTITFTPGEPRCEDGDGDDRQRRRWMRTRTPSA